MKQSAIIPIRPAVWWYVGGRKMFGREPAIIRKSWKVGSYGRSALSQNEGDRK